MARHTSLYQTPRSPLIQGRTRWERPLWQAWLAGTAIAAVILTAILYVRTASRRIPFVFDAATAWLLFGVVAGAAVGSLLGRLWGWRQRWIASALVGLVGGSIAYAVHSLVSGTLRF